MTEIEPGPTSGNVPRAVLAARLAAIRASIRATRAAPYAFGRAGPHRRQRDEFLLQVFAADIHARLVEAAT